VFDDEATPPPSVPTELEVAMQPLDHADEFVDGEGEFVEVVGSVCPPPQSPSR